MDTCIISQILKQCDNVLADDKRRVWATRLNNGKGGVARYLVTDFRAFGLLSGIVRYYSHIKKIDERIFYRGQPSEWTLKPKLYRTCAPQNCNNETDVRLAKEKMSLVEEWKKSAMEIVLSEHFDFQGSDEEREAIPIPPETATSRRLARPGARARRPATALSSPPIGPTAATRSSPTWWTSPRPSLPSTRS